MALLKARKKHASKKLKVSWRKHTDIHDVEEFLEDQRLEERLGLSLSTISDNELFKVDIKPSVELLSKKEKQKLKAKKPLNCFSALAPSTKVSDPIAKRNRVKTKDEHKNDLLKKKEIENLTRGILKHKEIQANANRKLNELQRKGKLKRNFNKDLWESGKNLQIEQDEWVSSNTKKHNIRGVGIPLKSIKKAEIKTKSPFPAVEHPHPGMSYNPSFKDHQDLLRIVTEKEIKLIKEEDHLTRCTKGMFQKIFPSDRDQSWLVEMSEGLPSKNGTNIEENEISDNEHKSVNPPTKNTKKTLKQRKKQKEQLELEKRRRLIKLEKKKITDICKLNILNKKIEAIEKKQNILREKRMKRAEQKKNNTKVLNSAKFEEPDLEFSMGQDIAGNLKNMKVEGNLLFDRFKSMQKRNLLAPTKKQIRKKAKVKKYTKPGHKDEDWKKTVAR
ncbi:ribosome biogenesis protein NOP53 [Anoplophora glabripennis]|uniref:ribosome biogenesis protein NOP53 n=1 Tax=Anoplophora glabripennis TaxID=217634 RepID=UPI0008759463|nr:ribosome biogenesis protein NOP53 [Anoplophora glabripennis]